MDRLNKIERIKDELHATDFIVLKAMEGHDVREYGDYKSKRQSLRNEINYLQSITDEQYELEYPNVDPLEEAKFNKLMEINNYDQSDAVNLFYLSGQPMWLDAQTRQTLRISIESYLATGAEYVTKMFGNQQFTFPTQAWLSMLNALEVYAAEALNVTEAHKAAVNALETIEDIEQYDITDGYPEKLNLTQEWLRQRSQE